MKQKLRMPSLPVKIDGLSSMHSKSEEKDEQISIGKYINKKP